MNRHIFIWGIVIVGGLIVGLSLFSNGDEGGPVPPPTDQSNMGETIATAGTLPYKENDYVMLSGKIRGMFTNGAIDKAQMNAYLTKLDLSKQRSLVISINNCFSSCKGTEIKALYNLCKQETSPLPEINEAKKNCESYFAARAYRSKLSSFLKGAYTDVGGQALQNGFSRLISGKPFRSCSEISGIRSEMDSKISEFELFHRTYLYYKDKKDHFKSMYLDYEDMDNISKYPYYSTIISSEYSEYYEEFETEY